MPDSLMLANIRWFILAMILATSLGFAQMPQGPIVRDIEIEFVGPESISRDRILANLATQIGEPYSEFAVEEDVRSLYATGAVANVRIFAEPYEDGVKVTVLVQGKPIVEEIIIEGADHIKLKRIRKEISSAVGEPMSEQRLEDDRQKILTLYRDRFYSEADVTYVVQEIPNTTRVRLIFTINEGPKLVVKKITFIGNDSITPKDLRAAMKTKVQDLLTFFTKSGRLLPGQIQEDEAAIRLVYFNRGFADMEIASYQVQQLPDRDGVEVIVTIIEGIQYRVVNVNLEGVAVAPVDDVKALLRMNAGSLFTPKGMQDNMKIIRDFYGTRGYIDVMVVPEIIPTGTGTVDLTFRVDEGVQTYVNLINIQGNTRTKDRVIRRELAIKPGDVFDSTSTELSRMRLQNLNYFSRVEMVPQDTLVPGRKDLNVIVEEKRTGSFNFGAGFSTIDSLVGFAELQQSNFDLFNWPNFTGGGQRFRVRGQLGILRSDFVISLTEPWFLGYQVAAGVEGYYREANFLSPVYDQRNYGAAFQLRKPLFSYLSARAEYRVEGIEIFNVNFANTDFEIQRAQGYYSKSAISGGLAWDTRDSLFLTRRGELLEINGWVAGGFLGGNVQDYGVTIDGSKWFLLPWDLIFLMRGQIAVASPWSSNDYVPLFDRLYLGGANNLRGFDFRDVGPKDNQGNPVGGNSLVYWTGEITFPIITRLRGAIFTDWGYVNAPAYDYGFSNMNADIGVGVRVDLPIGPIRFDFGFPVIHDKFNNSSGKFNVNIGYQF